MNRKTMALVAALAVLGTGFGFAVTRTSALQGEVDVQERRLAALERRPAAEVPAPPEAGTDGVRALREQVDRLAARLDRLSGRPAEASASAASDGTGEVIAAADGDFDRALDRALEARKALKKEAKAKAKAERKATQPERDKARRLADFTRRFGLDPTQARGLQPILEDHHAQLTALYDRLKKAPEAEKPLLRQEIISLRQTAQDRYRMYLNPDQIARMEKYYADANRSLLGLPRPSQAPAPDPAAGVR